MIKVVKDIETSQKLLKQHYKEKFKELRKTAQNIENSPDFFSQKYENHKDKLQQLTKDHKN